MLPMLASTAWRASAIWRWEEGDGDEVLLGGRVEERLEGAWGCGTLWGRGPGAAPGGGCGNCGDETEELAVDGAAGGEMVLAWCTVVTVLVVVLVGGEADVADGGDGRHGLSGGAWDEDAMFL